MKKRILGLILAIGMLTAFVPVISQADSGAVADGVTWDLTDGTLTISGSGAIPDYKSSREVPWYGGDYYSIKHVKSENGITAIGNSAFSNSQMSDIDIADSVTRIGNSAFAGASRITSITIPKNVTSIGTSAFSSTSSLEDITVASGNTAYKVLDGSLISLSNGFLIAYPCGRQEETYTIPEGVTVLDRYSFMGANNLTGIDLAGTTTIRDGVFNGCRKLKEVTCSAFVTEIARRAFYSCYALDSITILNKNVSFGEEVFSNANPELVIKGYEGSTAEEYATANSLNFEVVDGSDVPVITDGGSFGDGFTWTVNGDTLTISGNGKMPDFAKAADLPWYKYKGVISNGIVTEGVTRVGNMTFSETNVENVELADSVSEIGYSVFQYANKLKEINFSKYVTSFGNYVFRGASALENINVDEENEVYKSVDGVLIGRESAYLLAYPVNNPRRAYTVPEEVKTIDRFSFYGARNLRSINFSNTERLRDFAFVDCSGLIDLVFPETVNAVNNNVFGRCSSLESVTVLNKDAVFGTDVFSNCPAGLVLKGYENSTTQTYAKENNMLFEVYDPSQTPAPEPTDEPEPVEYEYVIYDMEIQNEQGESIGYPEVGRGFIARISFTEEIQRDSEDYLFVAVYGTDGNLLSINYVQADFIEYRPFAIGIHIQPQTAEIGKIKAYIWEDFNSLEPLAKPEEILF